LLPNIPVLPFFDYTFQYFKCFIPPEQN